MALNQKLTTTVIIVLALALMVPVFIEAGQNFSGGSWQYAPYVETILSNLHYLLLAGIVLILAKAVDRGGI